MSINPNSTKSHQPNRWEVQNGRKRKHCAISQAVAKAEKRGQFRRMLRSPHDSKPVHQSHVAINPSSSVDTSVHNSHPGFSSFRSGSPIPSNPGTPRTPARSLPHRTSTTPRTPARPLLPHPIIPVPGRTRHFENRSNNAESWLRLLPLMVYPYMEWCEGTQNGAYLSNKRIPPKPSCACKQSTRSVTLVSMDGKPLSNNLVDPVSLNDVLLPEAQTEHVTFCDCSPLPVELIRLGFFPAAPCRPKIAYHLNALLFASNLFLRISPNITAWCSAWLACLQHKGVEFGSKVGLTLVCCLNDR
jgi:hypothetical protein